MNEKSQIKNKNKYMRYWKGVQTFYIIEQVVCGVTMFGNLGLKFLNFIICHIYYFKIYYFYLK